ncbi:DNA replication factor Cdt1, partial [Orchesella cincta]
SPSITQFFKVHRKRPRSGKDDGIVSAPKKLLLEEGIVVNDTPPAKRIVEKPLKLEKTKESDVVEKSAKSVEERPKQKVAKSTKKKINVEAVEKKKNETEKPNSSKGDGSDNQPAPLSAVPASPVKFLKVASLSPAKKKQLTTEQVAKLLKKKKKLADLKAAMEGINNCAQKLDDFRRTVNKANAKASPAKINGGDKKNDNIEPPASTSSTTKAISSAKFYSPSASNINADLARLSASKVGSPSKLVNLNNKVKKRLFDEQPSAREGDKKMVAPAYQRLHTLAQKTAAERGSVIDEEADLPLPYNFRILKDLFIGVETVVGIMKGRKETITFPKVKTGVLELVKKVSLREKHLAQMVTVLPGCYSFGLEKIGKDTHIRITVEDLLPSVICARRKAFHANLIKICLEHHSKFLSELVPPIIVPADKQITRWHPKFKIDEISDIQPSEDALPTKPAPEKLSSAREVIAKAQNILENANPRMKQAMKNMLDTVAESETQKISQLTIGQPKLKSSTSMKALKGVSQSLLEKIRNREREKLLTEMTRSPAESKKLMMIKRLPNFVKIIRNTMVSEKKVALPMDIVVDRVSHSLQSMTAADTQSHVRLLTTLLPNWIKIIKLSHSDMEYVRIDKATDINDLLEELNEIIKKHSS